MEELARGFYGATGNAIDAQGNLLQVEHYAGTVVKIGRWGEIETLISGLQEPLGLALDSRGRIYLTEARSHSIKVNGRNQVFASSELFDQPTDLVWARGTLYVVNGSNGIVAKVDSKRQVTEFARIPGDSNSGITYGKGSLYVTSARGNMIYRVGMDGAVEVLAGTGARGLEDGPRLEAKLSRPGVIAFFDGKLLFDEHIDELGPLGAPLSLIALRKLRLQSISDVLLIASASGEIADLVDAYHKYSADPAHLGKPNEAEIDELAARLMRSGAVEMSHALLRLNAESHPESSNAYARLGAALASGGKIAEALRAYRRAQKLNPGKESTSKAITELRHRR